MMHKRYKKQIVNEINALHPKHSQDFWRYINQLRKSDAAEEETLFRQKIGYVIIRSYYMIARKIRTFQMKILTWKTKIHRITTF